MEAVKKGKGSKDEMISSTNHDCNFATINKSRFGLIPSSFPMISPVQSIHISAPSVPPDKVTETHLQTTANDGVIMTLTKDVSVSAYTSPSSYSTPFDDSIYETPAFGTYNKTTNDLLTEYMKSLLCSTNVPTKPTPNSIKVDDTPYLTPDG